MKITNKTDEMVEFSVVADDPDTLYTPGDTCPDCGAAIPNNTPGACARCDRSWRIIRQAGEVSPRRSELKDLDNPDQSGMVMRPTAIAAWREDPKIDRSTAELRDIPAARPRYGISDRSTPNLSDAETAAKIRQFDPATADQFKWPTPNAEKYSASIPGSGDFQGNAYRAGFRSALSLAEAASSPESEPAVECADWADPRLLVAAVRLLCCPGSARAWWCSRG